MWPHDVLFVGLVGAGVAVLCGNLWPRRGPVVAAAPAVAVVWPAEDQGVIDKVNATFRAQWAGQKLVPTRRAPELAIAPAGAGADGDRAVVAGDPPARSKCRDGWRGWLDAILPRPPHADYLAERLARAFVGTEDGPFLLFRRRRFVSWLSDALLQNRPYDAIVRDLIADDGLWTDQPATNFLTVTIDPRSRAPTPDRLAAPGVAGVPRRPARLRPVPRPPLPALEAGPISAAWRPSSARPIAASRGIRDGARRLPALDRKTARVAGRRAPRAVPARAAAGPGHGGPRDRLAAGSPTRATRTSPAPRSTASGPCCSAGRWSSRSTTCAAAASCRPALLLLADDFAAHGYDLRRLIRVIAATEVVPPRQRGRDGASAEHEAKPGPSSPDPAAARAGRRQRAPSGVARRPSARNRTGSSRLVAYTGQQRFRQPLRRHRRGRVRRPRRHHPAAAADDERRDRPRADSRTACSTPRRSIAWLAPDDRTGRRGRLPAVLTRRPTPEEPPISRRLAGTTGDERKQRLEDLFWALLNSTEFSWNH